MEVKIVALSFSLLINVHLTYFIVNHLSLMNFSSSLYTNTQECLPQSHNMASLWNLPSLSRYYFLSLLSILNLIFLNYFLHPPLAGLPPSPTRLSTFCPRVNISHCCCRWCVMRETERSLCARSVGAAVCDFLPCGVSWQACGCWRQPADCPSVCRCGYTWLALTLLYQHTRA